MQVLGAAGTAAIIPFVGKINFLLEVELHWPLSHLQHYNLNCRKSGVWVILMTAQLLIRRVQYMSWILGMAVLWTPKYWHEFLILQRTIFLCLLLLSVLHVMCDYILVITVALLLNCIHCLIQMILCLSSSTRVYKSSPLWFFSYSKSLQYQ
jgi:hypothetical protein